MAKQEDDHCDSLPVYLADRTDVGSGSVSLVVARRNRDGTVCYATMLIDLWKLGLKDSFGSFSVKRKKFDEMYDKMMERLARGDEPAYFHPTTIEEAKWLVAQGLRIASAVGTPASRHWIRIVGELSGVSISGSLYKCFSCERGELDPEIDSYILDIARDEGKQGVAGTPEESIIHLECAKCRGNE